MKLGRRQGQAVVEGAFAIPVMFLLLLLLLQPGILLYDRIVMGAAAAEGCRMLATRSDDAGVEPGVCEEAIRRHLGAIPQQENFHCHQGGCSWRIELDGDEHATETTVRITGDVKLLPLLDMGGTLLGMADGSGKVEVSVEASAPTQNAWVAASDQGMDPVSWVLHWE